MKKLILGLGNPGTKYAKTYHNAGVVLVEALAKNTVGSGLALKTMPTFSYAEIEGWIWAISKTFMNESGRAAKMALKKFNLTLADLILVHDDSDLPLGKFRLDFNRGAAGHHGVESVMQVLGTQKFWRLRVGTRTKPGKAGEFALTRMSKADQEIIYGLTEGVITKLKEKLTP